MLHVAYEDGMHYNSLRRGDDFSRGQPADIPEAPLAPLSVGDAAQAQAAWSAADEQLVAAGTGCDNVLLVRQQLAKAGADVAAAIEAVIDILATEEGAEPEALGGEAEAEQGPAAEQQRQQDDGGGAVDAAGGQPGEPDAGQASSCSGNAAAAQVGGSGNAPADKAGDAASPDAGEEGTGQRSSSSSSSSSKHKGVKLQGRPAVVSSSSKGREKAPGRNKACPCRSGRRFKLCCGAASKGAKPEKAPAGGGSGGGLPVQLATLHI
jgi:hypothetical protein